jgi:methionyl-tRNA formyltransferase
LPTCQRLVSDGHAIPLVVVRRSAEVNSKRAPAAPVRDWAMANHLPVYAPTSVNDAKTIEELKRYAADLLFVCDFGQILSQACLSVSKLGGINLHGSLLPRHRGAAPVQWTLLRGDTQAGVSVIHMTPRLDGGPILAMAATDILPDENSGQLEPRLAQLGVDASLEAIDKLSHWDLSGAMGCSQEGAAVTKAPRFAKGHGQIDFRLPAEYLVRQVRALQPWPGTFADLRISENKSTRMLVRSARSIEANSDRLPGTVWSCTAKELGLEWSAPWQRVLAVATGDGTLFIARLQPTGKREMDAEEFLRGHQLTKDSRFELPEQPLACLDT